MNIFIMEFVDGRILWDPDLQRGAIRAGDGPRVVPGGVCPGAEVQPADVRDRPGACEDPP